MILRYYKILNNGEIVGYQTHYLKLDYDYLEEISEEEYERAVVELQKLAEAEILPTDEISADEFLQLIEEAF